MVAYVQILGTMDVLLLILFLAVIIVLIVTLYLKLSCGHYEIKEDLTNKTILITGGSSGIKGIVAGY